MEGKKDYLSIFIASIAIIIIIALSFFYYYFITKTQPVPQPGPVFSSFSTQIIKFSAPENLPEEIKNGYCWVNSIAQPFREDAWRCMADDSIYDPCFKTELSDLVYCKKNPFEQGNDFLINLTELLPAPSVLYNARDNWAWFLELNDGTVCSPYTGTRPFFQGQIAYYGCSSNVEGQQVSLMGELVKGKIWTAKKAIILRNNNSWIIQSEGEVKIKTIWQ